MATAHAKLNNNILTGDINPKEYFGYIGPMLDFKKCFDYPIDSFGLEGSWEMNNSKTITKENIEFFKQLIYSPYDEIYYLQDGRNDHKGWYIYAKVGEYYIHFEASCDFTGFCCRGDGGSFGYSTEWKTLWNSYMKKNSRDALLMANDYKEFVNMELQAPDSIVSLLKHATLWSELEDE